MSPGLGSTAQKTSITSSDDKVMTQDQVSKVVEENEAFASAIIEYQRQGRVAEAIELQKRLQRNIFTLMNAYHKHLNKIA